jgi:hypothetical protein
MSARAVYFEIFIVVTLIGALVRAFLPPKAPIFVGGCVLIVLCFLAWFGTFASQRMAPETGAVLMIFVMVLLPVLFLAWWLGWGIGAALKPYAADYVTRINAPSRLTRAAPTGVQNRTDDSWLPIVILALIIAALVLLLPNARPAASAPQPRPNATFR